MRRLNFGVVTLAVTLLGAFALLLAALRPSLPPQKANGLATEKGDYIAEGVHQRIDWRTLDSNVFAEARRLGRPVMLVMGAVWSSDAVRADKEIFSDPEVQNHLNRNYLCVRLDLDRYPHYLPLLAPVSRASNPFTVGMQIVFVQPDGEPYHFLSLQSIGIDASAFLDQLVAAHSEFMDLTKGPTRASQAQTMDRNMLRIPSQESPLSGYLDQLREQVDPVQGVMKSTAPTARMTAWLALLESGDGEGFDAVSRRFLQSGLVDWLDGGFFNRAQDPELTHIEFGKPALFNAELMYVLALAGQLRDNLYYTRIAKNTFDWLTGRAVKSEMISTARIAMANTFGRDDRSSFSAKEMRTFGGAQLLTPEETAWARKALGLRVEDNATMTVRIRDPRTLDDPRFASAIEKLRKARSGVELKFTTVPRADVNGIAIARLAVCARLWNDPRRLEICRRLYDRLDQFLADDDVAHTYPYDMSIPRYLGDYLGYADASLSLYLGTGKLDYLTRGERVLHRASQIFATDQPGVWATLPQPYRGALKHIDVPEIIDNIGESLTARMMRLTSSYARLHPTKENLALADGAYSAMRQYSGVLPQTGLLGAGILCAGMSLIDDQYAVAVGPNAVGDASALARRIPTRLVAPYDPSFKLPGIGAAPGVYLVSGTGVVGPMTVDQAAAQLPLSLNPG